MADDIRFWRADDHDDCDCPDCRDEPEFFCGDPDCGCGDGPDDDAGHGDATWGRRIETVDTGGLL